MKIVVCTLAINDWYRDIVKYALRNIELYTRKHGYYVSIHTDKETNSIFDGKRAPCWYKIKLIQKLMTEHPDSDYIFWIDADSQILKHDVKLEYFIDKYFENDTEIVVTQDNNVLNTGVMFLKNTKFVYDLLTRIWENPNSLDFYTDFHEQTSFADIYTNDEEVRKKVKIIPYGIKDEMVIYWSNYFPGRNFIVHCARCSQDKLSFMYMMDVYYPFKLDEETDEEFEERLSWLNTPDICMPEIEKNRKKEYCPRKYSARCKKIFGIK